MESCGPGPRRVAGWLACDAMGDHAWPSMADVGARLGRLRYAAALASGPTDVMDFLLPLWAAADIGATPAAIGLVVAIEAGASLAVRPVAGVLADRADRQLVAAIGAALYAAAFVVYAVAPGIVAVGLRRPGMAQRVCHCRRRLHPGGRTGATRRPHARAVRRAGAGDQRRTPPPRRGYQRHRRALTRRRVARECAPERLPAWAVGPRATPCIRGLQTLERCAMSSYCRSQSSVRAAISGVAKDCCLPPLRLTRCTHPYHRWPERSKLPPALNEGCHVLHNRLPPLNRWRRCAMGSGEGSRKRFETRYSDRSCWDALLRDRALHGQRQAQTAGRSPSSVE